MLEKGFQPLCVIPAVPDPDGTGIRFLHPEAQYVIAEFADEVWAILAQCDGHQKVAVVLSRAHKQVPHESRATLASILEDLCELGVVVDSRNAFRHFHFLSSNPQPYTQALSFREVREYTDSACLPMATGKTIPLTAAETYLQKLQRLRRSCHGFSARQLTSDQLGQLLLSSYSISAHSVPSADRLYPLRLYVIVTSHQADLSTGYYEYDLECRKLVQLCAPFDREMIEYAFDSETLVFGAPSILVLAADMQRQTHKYANRGYRYSFIEAGEIAQNVCLAAAEQGLATLLYGGFLDSVLAQELRMDVPRVMPLIAIGVGYSAGKDAFNARHLLESLQTALVGPHKPIHRVYLTTGYRPEEGSSFFGATAQYRIAQDQNASRSSKRRLAGGSASSSAMAEVKALAEGYERYASSLIRVDLRARASELQGRWLDPAAVVPFSPEQFTHFTHLQPFDKDIVWEWVQGIAPATNEAVWVPVDLVFYPITPTVLDRKPCYKGNSSGVAAYTTREEAIKLGLLELVERDALMRCWFQRQAPGQIPLELLPYHWQRRVEYWRSQGREVYVLDQSEFGIVSLNVLIVSETKYPCVVTGASASLTSFSEAISKAFREAELGVLYAPRSPMPKRIRPEKVAKPTDHALLYAYPDHIDNLRWLWQGALSADLPVPSTSVDKLLDICRIVVVQLSPQEAPLHVIRVMSENLLVPINFGWGTSHYTHTAIREHVSLESLRLPHYFP